MAETTERKPAKIVLRELQDKIAQDAWDAKNRGEKVGWCASNFPQEITTAMDIPVVYPENMGAAVGAVVGLVAITPCADVVTIGQAFTISFLTTLICNVAVYWKAHSRIDDALDVFPTHGVGGIVATIFTGVFAQTGLIAWTHAGFMEFVAAVAGVAIVIAYTFVVSMLLYWITNRMIGMRVSPPCEAAGLDLSQHDEVYGAP